MTDNQVQTISQSLSPQEKFKELSKLNRVGLKLAERGKSKELSSKQKLNCENEAIKLFEKVIQQAEEFDLKSGHYLAFTNLRATALNNLGGTYKNLALMTPDEEGKKEYFTKSFLSINAALKLAKNLSDLSYEELDQHVSIEEKETQDGRKARLEKYKAHFSQKTDNIFDAVVYTYGLFEQSNLSISEGDEVLSECFAEFKQLDKNNKIDWKEIAKDELSDVLNEAHNFENSDVETIGEVSDIDSSVQEIG